MCRLFRMRHPSEPWRPTNDKEVFSSVPHAAVTVAISASLSQQTYEDHEKQIFIVFAWIKTRMNEKKNIEKCFDASIHVRMKNASVKQQQWAKTIESFLLLPILFPFVSFSCFSSHFRSSSDSAKKSKFDDAAGRRHMCVYISSSTKSRVFCHEIHGIECTMFANENHKNSNSKKFFFVVLWLKKIQDEHIKKYIFI